MLNKMEQDIQGLIMVVGMSLIGGLANFFRDDGPPKWPRIFAALLTAAFSGLLSYEITIAMGFDIHVQCIISGIAGYGGGTMLDETYQKIHDFIMKKADEKVNGE